MGTSTKSSGMPLRLNQSFGISVSNLARWLGRGCRGLLRPPPPLPLERGLSQQVGHTWVIRDINYHKTNFNVDGIGKFLSGRCVHALVGCDGDMRATLKVGSFGSLLSSWTIWGVIHIHANQYGPTKQLYINLGCQNALKHKEVFPWALPRDHITYDVD